MLTALRPTESENGVMMPTGRNRNPGNDRTVPAEGNKREAQDRQKSSRGKGSARSPVDAMHTDAPNKQDNARGHRKSDALRK